MSKIQRPKGTQDIYGDGMAQWHRVETTIRQFMHGANYQEIRTPVFEATELFARGVGDTTDIVNKEMYTFEKGERSLTLRPENTAGVVRAYIENGMSRLPKPVKLFYIGPMFRYERPQSGRQRQFHQAGLELFGLDTPASDAEAVILAMQLFQTLGIPDLRLEVNNIGSVACRERFKTGFKALIEPYLNTLCEDCRTRFEKNPLRMLDCKQPGCGAIYSKPEIQSFLEQDFTSPEYQERFQAFTGILDSLGIAHHRNYRLVRGLDYYTGLVFEITSGKLGAQNTVCGGGRYDGLVELLGGPATPAVGWALGMERLTSLMPAETAQGPDYCIVSDDVSAAFKLAGEIRARGQRVDVDLSGKAMGKQLAYADKIKAAEVILLGEQERTSGNLTIKQLSTGEQRQISQSDFLKRLQSN
jgi:histidyl-tRNA synthetase